MNEWEFQLLEDKIPAESVEIAGCEVKKGDRVVLRPHAGGDIFDLALTGQTAIVEAIEQDYEGKLQLAVVLEDDPGRDLGVLRQPGHRFFFKPEEVGPCAPVANGRARIAEQAKILVAGIGNIFLGDDGFGVEVVRRLASHEFPGNVMVRDFGIRSYDLTYALIDGYDLVILIDACPHGQVAGTISVIEPELDAGAHPATLDAHTMNPVQVLRLARQLGSLPKRILLVACEPASLGVDDGEIGLSAAVATAVAKAVEKVETLIEENGREQH